MDFKGAIIQQLPSRYHTAQDAAQQHFGVNSAHSQYKATSCEDFEVFGAWSQVKTPSTTSPALDRDGIVDGWRGMF
jgi:hypothetical protein